MAITVQNSPVRTAIVPVQLVHMRCFHEATKKLEGELLWFKNQHWNGTVFKDAKSFCMCSHVCMLQCGI